MNKNKEILEQTAPNDTQKVSIGESAKSGRACPPQEGGELGSPEIDQLQTIVAELSDKYLRARAEIENTRRRAALDADSLARGRAVAVAENFLPIVDAINAALGIDPANEGIKALAAAADSALAKTGITRIDSIGKKMNPLFHNVVSTEPAITTTAGAGTNTSTGTGHNTGTGNGDGTGNNTGANTDIITKELQTGYMFGDTVLRPAMVVVAK